MYWNASHREDDEAGLAYLGTGCGRAGGHCLVERRRDLLPRASPGEVVVDRRDELRAAAEAPGVRLRARLAGEVLELDRRLALVRNALAHAEERRDRVEEAAHPRGKRRVRLQALAHERPALPWHGSPGRFEVNRCAPPRLPDRRLAARERHRLEVRDALELSEVAAEELAAPERPVRPVARAVEDERERRPLLPVLGEAGGCVRVVVLHPHGLRLLLERPLRRQVLGMK